MQVKKVRNILIEIEYDGTNYCGWQIQLNGKSIQEEIVKSIRSLTGEKICVNGAGRTDSGVHARGQAANFIITSGIPTERIPLAMNRFLPEDITVLNAKQVPIDFHARYWAEGKRYSYQIYNDPKRSSLLRNYCWHIPYYLDMDKIQKASQIFIGTHDFAGFMAAGSKIKNTVRRIYDIQIHKKDNCIWITFEGNGFLYKMVRMMVATLMDVGLNRCSLEKVCHILESANSNRNKKTAPPQGLFLDKVFYPLTH
jgi:tRNA pseudouridine38-40 synthase